jgi:hypothetical protein
MITTALVPGVGVTGNADLFVMNADGSDLHEVTDTVRWESTSDWGSRP